MRYDIGKILESVDKFKGQKIGIIGDVMLDRFTYGDISRVSPEAPGVVFKEDYFEDTLGGAGNVAKNVVELGGTVYLSGAIGVDHEGGNLRVIARNIGIDPSYLLANPESVTTFKERFIDKRFKQQLSLRRDRENKKPKIYSKDFRDILEKILEQSDLIVLSDYDKGVLSKEVCEYVIRKSKSMKKRVVVDPKKDFSKFRGAYLIKPNKSEIESVISNYEANERKVYKLMGQLDLDAVIITKGEDGMTLFESNRSIDIPALKDGQVTDITGAGDSVIAGLALSLVSGLNVRKAAFLSNVIGGLVVRKPGTATVTQNELKETLNKLV